MNHLRDAADTLDPDVIASIRAELLEQDAQNATTAARETLAALNRGEYPYPKPDATRRA